MTVPVMYTLTTCPTCAALRSEWTRQGVAFEERPVDQSQAWLDEALNYGDTVPVIVYPDGRVEIGFAGGTG